MFLRDTNFHQVLSRRFFRTGVISRPATVTRPKIASSHPPQLGRFWWMDIPFANGDDEPGKRHFGWLEFLRELLRDEEPLRRAAGHVGQLCGSHRDAAGASRKAPGGGVGMHAGGGVLRLPEESPLRAQGPGCGWERVGGDAHLHHQRKAGHGRRHALRFPRGR